MKSENSDRKQLKKKRKKEKIWKIMEESSRDGKKKRHAKICFLLFYFSRLRGAKKDKVKRTRKDKCMKKLKGKMTKIKVR